MASVYVLTFASCFLNFRGNQALCLEGQFFQALMKLRPNLLLEEIAHRFGVSLSTASCTFSKRVDILFTRLHFLIAWPQREILLQNMPPTFSQLYPRCVCVIHCSEIFIETLNSFTARSALIPTTKNITL